MGADITRLPNVATVACGIGSCAPLFQTREEEERREGRRGSEERGSAAAYPAGYGPTHEERQRTLASEGDGNRMLGKVCLA